MDAHHGAVGDCSDIMQSFVGRKSPNTLLCFLFFGHSNIVETKVILVARRKHVCSEMFRKQRSYICKCFVRKDIHVRRSLLLFLYQSIVRNGNGNTNVKFTTFDKIRQ